MMINKSKFSKSLTIFLVYNIIIILTVTCNYILEAKTEGGNGESDVAEGVSKTTNNENDLNSKLEDIKIKEKFIEIHETTEFVESLQDGIREAKISVSSDVSRPLCHSDFMSVTDTEFKSWFDSNKSPARHHKEFHFVEYAPYVFRHFRLLFGINTQDYLTSFCAFPLREMTNPGASGSKMFITMNGKFILKSLKDSEGDFFREILPFYMTHLKKNPGSLLPKFFGFYGFVSGLNRMQFISMNNLLPRNIQMHLKYDLKGSSYRRTATPEERKQKSPTYKDNDFRQKMAGNLYLMKNTLSDVLRIIEKDANFLQRNNIMDYSMLLGIYNITQDTTPDSTISLAAEARWTRLMNDSIEIEDIHADTANFEYEKSCPFLRGSIPAENEKGEKLFLFVGIIDVLQDFRIIKFIEYGVKTIVQGSDISVQPPDKYAPRFVDFLRNSVLMPKLSPEELELSKKNAESVLGKRPYNDSDNTHNLCIGCFKAKKASADIEDTDNV
ncbi:phosphatidylinositol 4-phosphate 5-kinase type-1 beta-like [Myzus persicae]|uniref:phosphatidylinositol 4-phosphate 5-kinase type-1 beta-like n=1 Tax=Myzus persicae TaxID=13164 RepID=UPI000B935525|nr:phosphatidylinositol 4-phosphate 5-kinase type-1 beta-like [Myzus persicae]